MVPVKKKKKAPGTREKSILNHHSGEKENIIGQKRKKRPTSSDPLKNKSSDMQSVSQKKTKHFREHCNATITRVEPIIKLT